MKLEKGETLILETSLVWTCEGIWFPLVKGGRFGLHFQGVKGSLTNKRIVGEWLPLPNIIIVEIPIKAVTYVRPDNSTWFNSKIVRMGSTILRIGYREGRKEKEVFFWFKKKDFDKWAAALKKLRLLKQPD